MKILGISGSNRKGSYNWGPLEAAKEMLPDNTSLEVFDVSRFPPFAQDHERDPPADSAIVQTEDQTIRRDTIRNTRAQLYDHCSVEERDRVG